MQRREFMTKAGLTVAYGMLTAQAATHASSATASTSASGQIPDAVWKDIQKKMNYSDEELEIFKGQPRTQKIISRFSYLGKIIIAIEVKQSHGCIVGHKPGERFVFPGGGALDMKNSTQRLCPFLMPPMTRIMWLLQERVWEGLDPLPLYATGQCDDVGIECNGWGKVLIEARLMKPSEVQIKAG